MLVRRNASSFILIEYFLCVFCVPFFNSKGNHGTLFQLDSQPQSHTFSELPITLLNRNTCFTINNMLLSKRFFFFSNISAVGILTPW